MKFSELNENNYVIFAIKNYENPHAVTKEDFEEDLKRFKWIKRLLKRDKTTGVLKAHLLINQFIIGIHGQKAMKETVLMECLFLIIVNHFILL